MPNNSSSGDFSKGNASFWFNQVCNLVDTRHSRAAPRIKKLLITGEKGKPSVEAHPLFSILSSQLSFCPTINRAKWEKIPNWNALFLCRMKRNRLRVNGGTASRATAPGLTPVYTWPLPKATRGCRHSSGERREAGTDPLSPACAVQGICLSEPRLCVLQVVTCPLLL